MDLFSALILSLVEGITEFLPISSTGHLILTTKLLNISQTEFVKTFEVCIQLGAILAVVSLYWRRLITNLNLCKKILVAFLPTAVLGLVFYKLIKDLFSSEVVLLSLFVGGIFIILFEKFYHAKGQNDLEKITFKDAFLIGLAQSVSMIPGVSRAAATIFGGMGVGLNRKAAIEFSFLLAIPTMVAATGLDLVKSNLSFSPGEYGILLIGMLGSFLFAILAIKFLITFIQKNNFYMFGVYRIVLAIAFFLFIR